MYKYLEEEMAIKQMEFENKLKMKLNEKDWNVREECKRKLEERIQTVANNLKYEIDLKEKDQRCKMERKNDEMASVEESLLKTLASNNELGKLATSMKKSQNFNRNFNFQLGN